MLLVLLMLCAAVAGMSPTAGQQPPPERPQMLEAPPTPCLRMTNMLSEDMLKDDEEYSEIVEDIQEELSQYGKVRVPPFLCSCRREILRSIAHIAAGASAPILRELAKQLVCVCVAICA